jgi:protease I
MRTGKPVAVIGHGPWVLASAGVLTGRRLTGWPGIQDDIVNAGGEWVDEPYVQDGNLLSGRTSRDLSKFTKQLRKHVTNFADV